MGKPDDENAKVAGSGPATCSPFASVDEESIGRVLYLLESIIDHTKRGQDEIPGWRMKAIRETAEKLEKMICQ